MVSMKHRNVEVKMQVDDHAGVFGRLLALGAVGPVLMQQEDIFYHCITGRRIKLRRSGMTTELIYCRRADVAGPKLFEYWRTPVSDPDQLHEIFSQTNGLLGVVRKIRQLYTIGQTRIHLDKVVEHLGAFLELEVVLEESGSEEEGYRMAQQLISKLGLGNKHYLLFVSYFDLLAAKCNDMIHCQYAIQTHRDDPAGKGFNK